MTNKLVILIGTSFLAANVNTVSIINSNSNSVVVAQTTNISIINSITTP